MKIIFNKYDLKNTKMQEALVRDKQEKNPWNRGMKK